MTALAGLDVLTHGDPASPRAIVMLHGRNMCAADLAPFASSLGTSAYFVVPDAPFAAPDRGRTWWPIDPELRARELLRGPLDLVDFVPDGRDAARDRIAALCRALDREVVIVGFSQGGMLAMDHALHAGGVAGLALLSTSRIARTDWATRGAKLAGLPILVAHGRDDAELALSAGEGVRDYAIAGGARVTWLPFDGGHELPLVVWRALRKFLATI